jgi:hypothetical protein
MDTQNAQEQFPYSLKAKRRTEERRQALMFAAGAFGFVFLLWQLARYSPLMFPFRILVTFVHEAGHGLTAVLTGGTFYTFQLYGDGSGVAYTSGGSTFLIPQMGYLGAALFGAILLYATNRVHNINRVALGTSVFFIGVALIFASRSTGSIMGLAGTLFALASGFAMGVGFLALWRHGTRKINLFVLNAFAFIVGLNAVNDVWSLMSNRSATIQNTPNDAMAIATATHTPVEFWIILWTLLAIVMMGVSVYFALLHPIQVQQDSYQTPDNL